MDDLNTTAIISMFLIITHNFCFASGNFEEYQSNFLRLLPINPYLNQSAVGYIYTTIIA